ncbi:MAG TPA: hypothetical protein VGP88_04625 [Thermoplasmata archaeon]|nr:hypothetical protein [Thermoplasmata archaeon]
MARLIYPSPHAGPLVSFLQEIPFPGALAILAAGTVAGVYATARTGEWWWIVLALIAVGLLAVLYLREYAKLPGPEWVPEPRAKPVEAPAAAPDAPAPTAADEPAAESATAPSGPVEVDKFDPDYDPVAEADAIESHGGAPPPEP